MREKKSKNKTKLNPAAVISAAASLAALCLWSAYAVPSLSQFQNNQRIGTSVKISGMFGNIHMPEDHNVVKSRRDIPEFKKLKNPDRQLDVYTEQYAFAKGFLKARNVDISEIERLDAQARAFREKNDIENEQNTVKKTLNLASDLLNSYYAEKLNDPNTALKAKEMTKIGNLTGAAKIYTEASGEALR